MDSSKKLATVLSAKI